MTSDQGFWISSSPTADSKSRFAQQGENVQSVRLAGRKGDVRICWVVPRLELCERLSGCSQKVGSIEMVQSQDMEDEEFFAACELAAGLWFQQSLRVAEERKGALRGGSSAGKRPNVDRDFINAHVRILTDYFGRDSGLECMSFSGLIIPSPPAQPRYSDALFERRFRMPRKPRARMAPQTAESGRS
jgi:hypothetical protein